MSLSRREFGTRALGAIAAPLVVTRSLAAGAQASGVRIGGGGSYGGYSSGGGHK